MLGTSATGAWLMSHSSHRPIDPAYYIEDCRISTQGNAIVTMSLNFTKLKLFHSLMEKFNWEKICTYSFANVIFVSFDVEYVLQLQNPLEAMLIY